MRSYYTTANRLGQSAPGDLAAIGSVMRRGGSPRTGIVRSVDTTSDAEEFVAKFADFWKTPSPQRLPELLHPDVVLVQPLAPRTVGIEAAQQQFQRFCSCLPGLSADVDHWCGDKDMVFIEFGCAPTSKAM
jgi:SnoaL-like domain